MTKLFMEGGQSWPQPPFRRLGPLPAPQGPSFVSLYYASLNRGPEGVPRRCCTHRALDCRIVSSTGASERRERDCAGPQSPSTGIMRVGVGVRVGSAKGCGKSRQAQSIVRGSGDGLRRSISRIVADPRHSAVEERQVLMGISKERRLLAVMYIERAEAVRIIGARRATRPERRDYEETTQ